VCDNHDDRNLHQCLQELVAEACSYPPKSLQRRQKLNDIVRNIIKSGKLWQEDTPYYKDALQQTWLYLCRNLEQYNPAQGNVITWLDSYLKWRLHDYKQASEIEAANKMSILPLGEEETTDPINNLPYKWVQTDPDGDLRSKHIKGRPDVTCQVLILRRLPPESHWEDIAQEFRLSLSTVANFYNRECLPRLRNFAQNQGYL
jgi:DNA-directed RNA polymerase specialized sigma24 family protein